MKFCVSNGITATESFKEMQKGIEASNLLRTQVFEGHNTCSEGLEDLENLPHANRASITVNYDS